MHRTSPTPRGPDFLIVGAPKCATTAMDRYLAQHPQVYMCRKEQHHFGRDLIIPRRPHDIDGYLRLFDNARPGQVKGEAAVWYLMSRTAAAEIHAYRSEMKIIIMLRHPVDYMRSLFGETRAQVTEPLDDFAQALAAEPRRAAENTVDADHLPACLPLLYRASARFSEQVQRYLDVFPREQVHIILMDDIKRDVAGVYRDTLTFLGVDPTFSADLSPINERRALRSPALERFVRDPPWLIKRVNKALFNGRIRQGLADAVTRWNHVPAPPMTWDPDLRHQLRLEFNDEIRQLAAVIGRPLDPWIKPEDPPA